MAGPDEFVTVVVLIHGTWARGILRPRGGAAWTRHGAVLPEALLSSTGGGPVVIKRVCWSGRNLHEHRIRVAERIAELVPRWAERYATAPDGSRRRVRIHLVGHSHGGNAAVWAAWMHERRERDEAQKQDVADQITSVVCLSTPFLAIRTRSIAYVLIALLMYLGLGVILACGVVFPEQRAQIGFAGGVLLIFLLCVLLSGAWAGVLGDPERAALRVSTPGLSRIPVLVVRAPEDEASGTLAFVKFGAWVSDKLAALPGAVSLMLGKGLFARLPRPDESIWAFLLFGLPCGAAALAGDAPIWLAVIAALLGTAFGPAALLLCAVALLVVAVVLAYLPLAGVSAGAAAVALWSAGVFRVRAPEPGSRCGWLPCALGMVLSIEEVPAGNASVYRLVRPPEPGEMSHGRSHSSHEAAAAVAEWIRRCGEGARPTALAPPEPEPRERVKQGVWPGLTMEVRTPADRERDGGDEPREPGGGFSFL